MKQTIIADTAHDEAIIENERRGYRGRERDREAQQLEAQQMHKALAFEAKRARLTAIKMGRTA